MNDENLIKDLRDKLLVKTEENNRLRAKLRSSEKMFRDIIRQLETMLDEAGIDWRHRLESDDT